MKSHTTKLLVTWNVVLTVLLLIALAFVAASAQASNDPPIKVFTANSDDQRGGSGTGGGNVNSVNNTTLVSVNGSLGELHTHICLVTASARVIRYGAGTGYSTYGLSMDDSVNTVGASSQSVYFAAGEVDALQRSVTTTFGFQNVAGNHTFRLLGKKASAGATNVSVNNATMTIVCLKKTL